MAFKKLLLPLAAATLTVGSAAQAAAVPAPARTATAIEEGESLGGTGALAAIVFAIAVLAVLLFEDDNSPASP